MNDLIPKNWFERNWKWAVPAGCLSLIVLFALLFASIALFVFALMRASPGYEMALGRASADPRVQSALGTPIEPGYFVMGEFSEGGVSGHSELAIPISGPKGEGTIYVVGDKSAGRWTYSTLAVELEGSSQRIDLLPPED